MQPAAPQRRGVRLEEEARRPRPRVEILHHLLQGLRLKLELRLAEPRDLHGHVVVEHRRTVAGAVSELEGEETPNLGHRRRMLGARPDVALAA